MQFEINLLDNLDKCQFPWWYAMNCIEPFIRSSFSYTRVNFMPHLPPLPPQVGDLTSLLEQICMPTFSASHMQLHMFATSTHVLRHHLHHVLSILQKETDLPMRT